MHRGLDSLRPDPRPDVALEVDGRRVPLVVRRSRRARRLYLRVETADANVVLVLPRGVGLNEGLGFARERTAWVAERLAAIPPLVPFADGVALPLLGATATIRHCPEAHGPVQRIGADIVVAGRSEHVARRVRDWLKAEARRELGRRSHAVAARLGRSIDSVRLGDPKSRWGSCSAAGGLSFSWRLILAPPQVIDYVVAHEVAHLAELNHGRRFWRLLRDLIGDTDEPRAWLRVNGAGLLRYG
ncbi:MAG: M48 family metallopeptidase [Proteobacteria bacterium]|nr:M48 family metallopeptidase [Pseudomonadota bacterium]